MGAIEFVGAPGAGKSTIHRNLIQHERWYQPKPRIACKRRFLDTAKLKYRTAYRGMPSRLKSFFFKAFLTDRYQREAVERFSIEQPTAMQSMTAGVGAVEHQPEILFSLLRRAVERYQLGVQTVRTKEQLCLDESFALRAVSILWREPSSAFSLEKYLQETPTPEVLVHVRAPPDRCIERQRERGRIGIPQWERDDTLLELQAEFQSLCATIAEKQRAKTNVVEVETTDSLNEAVECVKNALRSFEADC